MTKIRCLIVEDAGDMGGVQFSSFYLATYFLKHQNIEATLLIPGDGPFYRRCVDHQMNVLLYHKRSLVSSSISVMRDRIRIPNIPGLLWNVLIIPLQIADFRKIFQLHNPDIVITKGIHAHICGSLAARISGISSVWHLQDLISPRFGGFFRWFFGLLAAALPNRIMGEQPMIEQLPARVEKKSDVVLNGIDLDAFYKPEDRIKIRQEFKISEHSFVIGHAARLIPWKGQHLLLEAFKKYAETNPNCHLILVGAALFTNKSYEDSLREYIRNHHLEEKVIMTGNREDLGSVLAAMDVFIYPSVEKDTMPLSLIAAWAAGLPVAVSNLPGLAESVKGNPGTLIFENKNISQITEAINRFEDTAFRNECGNDNRAWVETRYGLDIYGKSIETVIDKMVSH
jgi:glycosyltransferase involved in cell wall biosynthesis